MEGELTGYLGLGSNQGERLGMLRAARAELDARSALAVTASSSVYETAPQGEVTDQPDFLNACVRVETALGAEELLGVCKEVERSLGRASGAPRQGPRTIDVDLLLLGNLESRTERLILPHPGLRSRRFVLEPLLELDPALELPDGTRLADCLPAVEGQRVQRVGSL